MVREREGVDQDDSERSDAFVMKRFQVLLELLLVRPLEDSYRFAAHAPHDGRLTTLCIGLVRGRRSVLTAVALLDGAIVVELDLVLCKMRIRCEAERQGATDQGVSAYVQVSG